MLTRDQQKEIAVKLMHEMDLYKPYINKFKTKDTVVTEYERFAGFYIDKDSELDLIIKDVEKKYGYLVYAVEHCIMEFGELYNLLIVPQDEDDSDSLVAKWDSPNEFRVLAYVYNKDDEFCSETGDIIVRSFGGGITRIY